MALGLPAAVAGAGAICGEGAGRVESRVETGYLITSVRLRLPSFNPLPLYYDINWRGSP